MKIVVQVEIDPELLARLDRRATVEAVSRGALIRAAGARYLRQIDGEERANAYEDGYCRIPDQTSESESLVWLSGADLPNEEWPW